MTTLLRRLGETRGGRRGERPEHIRKVGSTGAILFYFAIVGLVEEGLSVCRSVLLLPLLSVGLAPSIAAAVISGLSRRGGVFERTPKSGLLGRERLRPVNGSYQRWAIPFVLLKVILGVYSLLPVAFPVDRATWAAIPFLLLYPVGFGMSVVQNLRERVPDGSRG